MNRIGLKSAASYELRLLSLWPATVPSDYRVSVRADSSAVTVAYPQFAVSGQKGDHTVFLQVQRIYEQINGSLSIEVESVAADDPKLDADGVEDEGGEAIAVQSRILKLLASALAPISRVKQTASYPRGAPLGPRISFALTCAPSYLILWATLLLVAVGVLLANANEHTLGFVLCLKPDTAMQVAPLVKGGGLIIAGFAAFFGFRKVPG